MTSQNTPTRIFKTGTTTIVEDESMRHLSDDDVRQLLAQTYPEVANATVRETVQEDGTRVLTYLPQVGKKG
jgi:PRTRC genetic system protein C